MKIGKWLVLELISKGTNINSKYLCRCDCGREKSVFGNVLRNGKSKGCLNCAMTKHGLSNNRLYFLLQEMKYRCYNTNCHAYKYYGGKGVVVFDEWLINPQSFIIWALNNGWQDGLSIDRIDSNGNYEPLNCRFTTSLQQSRNRSNSRILEYMGKKMSVSEWCEHLNLSDYTVFDRLNKRKWSVERALSTPTRCGWVRRKFRDILNNAMNFDK